MRFRSLRQRMEDMTSDRGLNRRAIARRTAQLPTSSRLLYRIDHHSSRPSAAIIVVGVLGCLLPTGAVLGFRSEWASGSELFMSAITLVMVFAIQHTQRREQAASQRKLDELLRALPGAEERLIFLEEAPEAVLRSVEDDQRNAQEWAASRPSGRV